MFVRTNFRRVIVERFLDRYKDRIVGSITGFDRILFRGQIQSICFPEAMDRFLSSQKVLYKEFQSYTSKFSAKIKEQAEKVAKQSERPYIYLASSSIKKEEYVRKLLKENPVDEGLICVLSCVEPCKSYGVRGDKAKQQLKLVYGERQCQHFYYYYLDRDFGLMHVRLQSWFPFTIQICVNGREWLARQLDKGGIEYVKAGNCFTEIGDINRAQEIFDSFQQQNLASTLSLFAADVNPWLGKESTIKFTPYYWTIRQGEVATDVMFRDPESLAEIYPALTNHAIQQFGTKDVMRFLGHHPDNRFKGDVKSSFESRAEGIRVKHWVNENSIKMYDKAGSVLRIETTINNPKRFRVRRHIEKDSKVITKCYPMRKGIADICRRVEVSHAANKRYLEALAVVGESKPSRKILDNVSVPIQSAHRRYRALRPVAPSDSQLFRVVLQGEYNIQGIRNEDLRKYLYPETEFDEEAKKRTSSRISRQLRLLCEHGLIFKVPKTKYYRVTKKGNEVMSTSLIFRDTNIALLAA